jgi:hypothetical protein
MCDVFICSDSGVGLCEADRVLLEGLGQPAEKGSPNKFGSFEHKRSDDRTIWSEKAAVSPVRGERELERVGDGGDTNNNVELERDRNRREGSAESVEKSSGCAGNGLRKHAVSGIFTMNQSMNQRVGGNGKLV